MCVCDCMFHLHDLIGWMMYVCECVALFFLSFSSLASNSNLISFSFSYAFLIINEVTIKYSCGPKIGALALYNHADRYILDEFDTHMMQIYIKKKRVWEIHRMKNKTKSSPIHTHIHTDQSPSSSSSSWAITITSMMVLLDRRYVDKK